jgi:hypothetical protein
MSKSKLVASVAAAAIVIALTAGFGAVAVLAQDQDDGPPAGYSDPETVLPERVVVHYDGNEAGWADRHKIYEPHFDGLTFEESQARRAEWLHTRVPVTAEKDPTSEVIGYWLPGIGYVDKATADSPDFDVDALQAKAFADQQQRSDEFSNWEKEHGNAP